MANKGINGSKGLFASIEENGKNIREETNSAVNNSKNESIKELTSKRSYELKNSTIKKLQEMKVFVYPDPNVTYNEIVDEAICLLYEKKKEKHD